MTVRTFTGQASSLPLRKRVPKGRVRQAHVTPWFALTRRIASPSSEEQGSAVSYGDSKWQ
jgi:hypothetical protein